MPGSIPPIQCVMQGSDGSHAKTNARKRPTHRGYAADTQNPNGQRANDSGDSCPCDTAQQPINREQGPCVSSEYPMPPQAKRRATEPEENCDCPNGQRAVQTERVAGECA